MTILHSVKSALFRLVHPSYWVFNYPYSQAWEDTLSDLLAKHSFTNVTKHDADLGPIHLWITNHPYASMHPYRGMIKYPNTNPTVNVRARALTIHLARRQLDRQVMGEMLGKPQSP